MLDGEITDGVYRPESELTRKTFLRALAMSGTGLAGLKTATRRAFGEEPDGVPIVWRRDRFGNPETINYVPKKRRRRIKVYENLPWETFHGRSDKVTGITLRQQSDDPTDLVLQVNVDQNKWSVRRSLPSRVKNLPVVVEEKKVHSDPTACSRRHNDFYDPLPANPRIDGYDDNGNWSRGGTLGFVGWNSNPDSPYKCYVTAAHVITFDDGHKADIIRHEGLYDGEGRTEDVGTYVADSPVSTTGLDAAKYKRASGTVSADVRGNADSHLGSVAGTWTYSGLTDATSGGGTVAVEFAGASTCYSTTNCVGTTRNGHLDYLVKYSPHAAVGGDSGGPLLDNNDFLVGLLTHECEPCDTNSGPSAQEVLDRLDVQLFDPRIN